MGMNAANSKYCQVVRTSVLSHAVSGTVQVVPFEAAAPGGNIFNLWEGTTNPSRITVNRSGWYLVVAALEFAANATGDRTVGFRKNGVASLIGGQTNKSATLAQEMATSVSIFLVANDFVEVWANQTSTAALNITATAAKQSPSFSLFFQRAGASTDYSSAAQTGWPL
jgi:hypothetical protein